jgi:hypothetical protein
MRTRVGSRRWASAVLTGTSLLFLAACGGSSSHSSDAVACRSVVADLRKVATAFTTITTKPREFASSEPGLSESLQADVKNVGNDSLKSAVEDFAAHLKSVGQALEAGKPPSSADATAFGADAQKINGVCTAAGVPATTK